MPVADRDMFAVEITLPDTKGLNETTEIADSVYNLLKQEDDVVGITRFIGCSSPRFHAAYAPKIAGTNYAQFIVNTKSVEATEALLDKYEPMLSEHYPNAFVKFKQLDFQNVPIFEYRFYGENIDSLRTAAEEMVAEMHKNPDIMYVHTDWQEQRPFIEVELDPVASSQLGINRTLSELQLALATGSTTVTSVWEGDYNVPVKIKDVNSQQFDCSDINNLYLSSAATSVPLRQIGDAH